jgi:hypothetical protein
MNNKELIRLAALAVKHTTGNDVIGTSIKFSEDGILCESEDFWGYWNPLENKSDALELAAVLDICIIAYPVYVQPKHSVIAKKHYSLEESISAIEIYSDYKNISAAYCMAITKVAAEIALKIQA